jgi:hypothetical protein
MTTTASSVSGVPISALGPASALTGAELVPIVQGGVTMRATVAQIAQAAGGETSVALAAGANNDVVIDDLDVAAKVAMTPAGDCTVTGFAGGVDGMRRFFVNRSASFTIQCLAADANSAAANRLASNGDIIMPPLCGGEYIYDGTNQRWVKT